MKRTNVLAGTGPSVTRAIPIAGCLLAGLMMALAFVLFVPGCASTSGGLPPGGRPMGGRSPWPSVDEIVAELSLEPEQASPVRAILEEAEQSRARLAGEMMTGGTRPDPSTMSTMRQRMDELNAGVENRLAELLTSSQLSQYRKMMQEAEQKRAAMRPPMGVPADGRGGSGGSAGGGGW